MNPTQKQPHTCGALADLTPADILRCAARYLELHGWIQRDYYSNAASPFPPACVLGAIGMAAHGRLIALPCNSGSGRREARRARKYLTAYLTDTGMLTIPANDWQSWPTATDWNDRDGQTAENVIATLRAAADNYDWTHASADQLETYAEHEYANEQLPTREGFLAWLGAR
ncbi:hypothetical protein ABZ744_21350 [Micromonospora chersina]|uniref:DUF6197 family protein n=1 Tax=Micromonospora chersina TaxID=47854 RepID=UPI00340441E2